MGLVGALAIRDALVVLPEVTRVEVVSDGTELVLHVDALSPSHLCLLVVQWSPDSQRLPKVSLREGSGNSALAHVSYCGEICHTFREGVAVDPTRPVDVAVQCVQDALRTLEDTLQRHARGDDGELQDEWEGYWESLPDAMVADLHLVPVGMAREIRAYAVSARGRRRCIAFSERKSARSEYGALALLSRASPVPALYVPLPGPVTPPSKGQPLSARLVANWVAQADSPTKVAVEQFLRARPRRVDEAYLLFSQPRREEGKLAMFGVGFFGMAAPHPLVQPNPAWGVSPIALKRHDRAYLTERGGAQTNLSSRQVAIVGCGAVGSRVAEQLALAGVGRLILVDPDVLTADNLFRHVLPADAVRVNKARAMKIMLERHLPDISIQAECDALVRWPPTWAGPSLDAVVLALGDPYVERRIAWQFHAQGRPDTPLVTCWMEPYGLGGHVVSTLAKQPGCLECLYRDASGISLTAPKTMFIEKGQHVGKNITGCGGAFTPYSALDASQTALLASRTVLDHLRGRTPPRYLSWRGDPDEFRAAGFRTSPWFNGYTEQVAQRSATEFSRCPCPVCNGT